MKRILGMVVALAAVLAYCSAAAAAPVTFNLSGVTGTWLRSSDANAAVPGPPNNGGPCAPGLASTTDLDIPNCFRYAFLPGSSVTVDITGSAVTMIGGTLNFHAVTPVVFNTVVLTMNATSTIYGATAYTPAATGTLVGSSILWATAANYSSEDTISCAGPNCGLIGPFSPLSVLTNSTPVTALVLGQWNLDSGEYPTVILGSTNAITLWWNVAGNVNRREGAVTFGPDLLGNPVPEPASAVIVLLGLGALALRSRKA